MNTLESVICARCGNEIPPAQPGSITTGYGIDAQGNKHCYACYAQIDREYMRESGRITLYLSIPAQLTRGVKSGRITSPEIKISNWPGSLEFCTIGNYAKKSRNNWGVNRFDVWFIFEGYVWHGVNLGDNQLLRCKRTKEQFPQPPRPAKHYIGMAGLCGYMPNYTTVGATRGEVAEDLGQLHELSGRAIAKLRRDCYLDLDLHSHGNEYAEIVVCDCGGNIESHADDPM